MRSILILTCCLALASVAAADQNKHKNKDKAAQVQQQQGQQQAVIKSGRRGGNAKKFQTLSNTSVNQPTVHANANVAVDPNNPNMHTRKGKFKAGGDLPGTAQSNTQFTKNKNFTRNKNVTRVNVKNFTVTKNFNNKYQAIKFRQGNNFPGSHNWQGNNYIAFRNYKSQWHDRDWWHHNHTRIVLIGGGWYYWDANYWYPAWGYDPGARYVYDGPIYAYHDMDPGQVVANVQSALQQQGYYEGDVDGLMGPLTRAALARYQADHGLYETAAIDQPTLEALGFA